jgi:serine protease inhibitor
MSSAIGRPGKFDLEVCLLMSCGIIEVAQQSKARRKDDFLIAFSPVIAEATATAYKGATNEVQQKLRRVVEVWRQRQIFELPIQEAIEARIEGISKSSRLFYRG